MESLPAILFPHSCLPEADIKKVLSLFGPLTLFRPWAMELPSFVTAMQERNLLQIIDPPEDMKPGRGFKTLLREYLDWSAHHQDRGYREFLKATRGEGSGHETTWAIRERLRRRGQEVGAPGETRALRWHFLLHLAREIDDQQQEADRLLATLKQSRSPLAGSLEEEPLNPLADLLRFREAPAMPADTLAQVVEAWVSLFEGNLENDRPWVTRNPQVPESLGERLEAQADLSSEPLAAMAQFYWPDLSQEDLDGLLTAREGLLAREAVARFQQALGHMGKETAPLGTLCRDMEKGLDWNASRGRLKITVNTLAPAPLGSQGDQMLRHLSGRRIILVEDA